jgi:hypothetical protein
MPGFVFAGNKGSYTGVPNVGKYLLANSMNGTGTPPAAAIMAGDVVCLTSNASLTSNSQIVVRMLLAADKTAVYKQGTPVAGILGVAASDVASTSTGAAMAPPAYLGLTNQASIPYSYSEPGLWGADKATSRNYLKVNLFSGGNFFLGRLDMAAGAITLGHQFDDALAGIILNTTSGVTTYTVDTTATGTSACLRIIGPNEQDPLYNTLVASGAATGPSVFFQAVGSFEQYSTGVVYTSQ